MTINTELLLLGSKINISTETQSSYIYVPTIEEWHESDHVKIIVNLLALSLKNSEIEGLPFKFESRKSLLEGVCWYLPGYKTHIEKFFRNYAPELNITDEGLFIGSKKATTEWLDIAAIYWGLGCGLISKDEANQKAREEEEKARKKEEEEKIAKMSPMERKVYLREKENARRIREARAKAQPKNDIVITPEKIIIGVMREFNLTIEDIKKMNYFGLYELFGYVFKIDHHQLMQKIMSSGFSNVEYNGHWLYEEVN